MYKDKCLITILGPTASGKSNLAIKLAKKYNGEIISCDSRQIYKGMDIGTGKVTKKEQRIVKHYLLDVANPKRDFNVSHFKKLAQKAIKEIYKKGKIPFLVGGSGFWIDTLIYDLEFPKVRPNKSLRKKLEKLSCDKLSEMLKKLDPERVKNIDKKNKRRLIRAIEIVKRTKKPIPSIIKKSPYRNLIIGIKISREKLYKNIERRLKKRFKQGMIKEVKNLIKNGVSYKRLYDFGLEYRYISLYLQGKITKDEMKEKLFSEIKKYARRQMTWFKKNKDIKWAEDYKEVEKLLKDFLNKYSSS